MDSIGQANCETVGIVRVVLIFARMPNAPNLLVCRPVLSAAGLKDGARRPRAEFFIADPLSLAECRLAAGCRDDPLKDLTPYL